MNSIVSCSVNSLLGDLFLATELESSELIPLNLKSGLAVVISNKEDTSKRMYMGEQYINQIFIDALGNCENEVVIDEEGFGNFNVKSKSTSVWVIK